MVENWALNSSSIHLNNIREFVIKNIDKFMYKNRLYNKMCFGLIIKNSHKQNKQQSTVCVCVFYGSFVHFHFWMSIFDFHVRHFCDKTDSRSFSFSLMINLEQHWPASNAGGNLQKYFVNNFDNTFYVFESLLVICYQMLL